jgi:hypothetical protein
VTDTSALQGIQLKTHPGSSYNDAFLTVKCNDINDKIAVVFAVPEDCNITGMACYCTQTGLPSYAPPYFKMNIQGVLTTSAQPDGTVKGTGSAETAAFQANDDTRHAVALGSSYAATQGELLAGVLEYASGTIGGSRYGRFVERISTVRYNNLPIPLAGSGGSWSASTDAWPVLTCTTDKDFDIGGIFNIGPASTTLSSSGHRWTMRISIPADESLELHVDGFRWNGAGPGGSGESYKVGIWNAAGTELVSATIDADQGDQSGYGRSRYYLFDETATITSDTVYCGFEHTGDDIDLSYAQVVHADALRSWPGGDMFYLGTWNGSAWTDVATSRPCMNLILSSLHGSGGGGSSIPGPSMGVIG